MAITLFCYNEGLAKNSGARLWQVGQAKREGSHLSNLPIPGSVDSVLPVAILLGLLRRMSTMNL